MRWCSVNETIARKRFQLMRPVPVILLAVVMIMIIVKYCSVPKLVSSLGPSSHTWNQPFDDYNLLLLGFPILGSWNAQLHTVLSHCWFGLVWFGLVGAANCLESIFMEFSLQFDWDSIALLCVHLLIQQCLILEMHCWRVV